MLLQQEPVFPAGNDPLTGMRVPRELQDLYGTNVAAPYPRYNRKALGPIPAAELWTCQVCNVKRAKREIFRHQFVRLHMDNVKDALQQVSQ